MGLAKNGMEEFRPEIERVAGGTNWAGKNGMEEFRPELEGVAGGINLAGKIGMAERRPDYEYPSGSLEELIWPAKMGWRNFVLNYKYINYYGEPRQEIPPANVLHSC